MKRVLLLLFLFACHSPSPVGEPLPDLIAKPETSVNPGINAPYLSPDVDVERWIGILEGESREIFSEREAIAAAVGLSAGDTIADIGSGTGIFLDPFSKAVGKRGTVYAVEIVPAFLDLIGERVREIGMTQVKPHLCTETSVELPQDSIDFAFICDVYHHFEYPRSSMASIHRALKSGGEVVIVDFEKIPGQTREFIMGHVRADKGEVKAELASFGFELVEEVAIEGLTENYFLRYRKR